MQQHDQGAGLRVKPRSCDHGCHKNHATKPSRQSLLALQINTNQLRHLLL